MYAGLLFLHSALRWLVVISVLVAIVRAGRGMLLKSAFTKTDDAVRHWTATVIHVQFVVGFSLYFVSPLIRFFWSPTSDTIGISFFAWIHPLVMFTAVIVATLSSVIAKRRVIDHDKFKLMLTGYSVTLLLIFVAIPWPFSPFANRPYLRAF